MRFIETICYKNEAYQNLERHQQRLDKTYRHFFKKAPFQLTEVLPPIREEGTWKVRIVYDREMFDVEYAIYQKRTLRSVEVVEATSFDYSFKYEDRTIINALFQASEADDILISIDGRLTDSSYSNLAFFTGKEWITPANPLLAGTRRSLLIDEGKIKEAPVHVSELDAFEKVSLINAMMDLGDLELPVSSVLKA